MKILLVEDHSTFADLLCRCLEGLDIHRVDTLKAAKEYLGTHKVGMLLLDLGLPDSQGLDTLRTMRQFKVPTVVLSGRFDISSEAAKLGAMDFLVKGADDPATMVERIMFNMGKIEKARKPRFEAHIFEEIKACFSLPQLTVAH